MELRRYGVQTTLYFPLIDYGATDFEATPVTHAAGDTQISIDGGAFANTTNAFAHEGKGIYSLVLTAAEMQGRIIVVTIVDSATKAWEDQAVVITTTGNASAEIPTLEANVASVTANAITASAIADNAIDAGAIASDAITATKIATGAITSAKFAAGAIDAAALAADAAGEIADAVWDEAVSGHQTNGTYGNAFDSANVPELAAVASSARNDIADSLLKRDVDQVEASAPVHSLASTILKMVSRFVASTGRTYRTDGTTIHMTQTPTTDAAADPVTSLGVAA